MSDAGREIGFVVEAKQYVLTIEGLPSAKVGDIICRDGGGRAIVRSLSGERLSALALDPGQSRAGDRYLELPETNLFSLGDHLFGRTINVLGEPADGGEPFPPANTPLVLDVDAPGIEVRVPITEQLETGLSIVDTLLPIAKGQRQLLFGPVKGGKMDFLGDIVRNQEARGTVCIYAAIGKSLSELDRIGKLILRGEGKNILIAALSDQPSPLIALAPSVAFLIADHFQRKGNDVLVILDDLDMHAKYLREIALLENRLPGRESYPGDLFYEHAHLLERSGCFSKAYGGGSITTLPVINTDAYSSVGIVSTNIMACTDGHLSFVSSLAVEGVYPAIASEQSITRVGRATQNLIQKQLSAELRVILSTARAQRRYVEFGSQVGKEAERALRQGAIIEYLLRQIPGQRIDRGVQVALLTLALTPFLYEQDLSFTIKNQMPLLQALSTRADLKEFADLSQSNMPLPKYVKKLITAEPILKQVCHA